MRRHSPAQLSARTCAVALGFALAGTCFAANERGLDAANLDPSAPACRDFFQYANGGWLKANPIPPEYSGWSLDDELRERNEHLLRGVLDAAAAKPEPAGSNTQKIGDFYATALDTAAAEKAGRTPIDAQLARIAALKTPADVAAAVREHHARGDLVLFDFFVEPDMKDPGTAIAYAIQGGLGLPDRDYYLRDDPKSKELLAFYRAYVAKLLQLAGVDDSAKQADAVVALETRLAKASLDQVAMRDPNNLYDKIDVKAANAKTPRFSWGDYFKAHGRADVATFSLAPAAFFAAMDQALADEPIATWRSYLRFHLVDGAAPFLSNAFVQAHFAFRGKQLRGAQELKLRWKLALDATNDALGEAVGQVYVARAFPPAAKAGAVQLVENLKKALRARLDKLAWMSPATKQAAYAKLDTLVAKIGYPDRWRDYSALTITRGSYYANVAAATAFEGRRQIAKIGKPVDRGEWGMSPQTVNAYFNPLQNEIVFPAAQLLPPYFDEKMDDAVNYGAIGAVIGHELLHGFDDQGSRFDAKGALTDWWTDADRKQFEARTAKLVAQFNAFVPIDDLHINGELTLGENIADLGGLQVAWDAWQLARAGKPAERIDGLTPEQRFFLSFAQSWRGAQRDAALRLQVQSNEHAPAKWRTLGPLANLPAFASAFSCKAGDAMVRPADGRVDIW
ncbi:MAG TPA: M13 family metallopeptidase [Tahibacter sp.]|nr:M13 family metallopeptidase [Tahibacter sp.]